MTASDLRLAVTGRGLVCSLGLDAVSACAATHAGLTRPTPMPGMDVYDPVENAGVDLSVNAVPVIADGFVDVARFARLGEAALADLASRTEIPEDGKTGICVALPSGYHLRRYEQWLVAEGTYDGDAEHLEADVRTAALRDRLVPAIRRFTDVSLHPSGGATLFEDEAGFGSLLRIAAHALQGGSIKRCLVGGIDSMLDPLTLGAWQHAGLLLTPENAAGAMPGEAAAFLLVERADADATGLVASALVEATEVPLDPETDGRAAGVALSACLQATQGTGPPGVVYTSLNGTAHRAFDWGCAQTRLRAADLALADQVEHPALAVGDVGAAAGPVAVCMAAHAIEQGYVPTRSATVWLSSDAGARASFRLSN